MRIASVDAWSGVSGDMMLGALLGAGVDRRELEAALRTLPLGDWDLTVETVSRAGLSGIRVEVGFHADQPHRNLGDILGIVGRSGLPPRAAARTARAFESLAEAEAEAHGCRVGDVHFHEVGAVDSIVDMAGSFTGFDLLQVERVFCTGVATGFGTVECAHGILPVPAPATAFLLRGIPTHSGSEAAELTTPTGAAILATLVDSWTPPPGARWLSCGMGAGSRDARTPNLLRLSVGESLGDAPHGEEIFELVTLVDDMDPRILPRLQEAVLEAGAVDCYAHQCIGRKGRPAIEVTALCRAGAVEAVRTTVFRESPTLGIRVRVTGRTVLERAFVDVSTPWGSAVVKTGMLRGATVNAAPEYESCAELARSAGIPVRVVLDFVKGVAAGMIERRE